MATVKVHGLSLGTGTYRAWISTASVSTPLGALHLSPASAGNDNELIGSFRLPTTAVPAVSRILIALRSADGTVGTVELSATLPTK